MKNILYYVSEVGNKEGYENIVSAHIQHPLECLVNLDNACQGNRKLILATNKLSHGKSRPILWKKLKNIEKVLLNDIYKPYLKMQDANDTKKLSMVNLLIHVLQLHKLIRQKNCEVIHFWGGSRIIFLATIFKLLFPNRKVIHTITVETNINVAVRFICYFLNLIIVSTEYQLNKFNNTKNVKVISPPVKVLRHVETVKNRVTFWRDPTLNNGADIAQDIFERLAPIFPNIIFTFAVRENSQSVLKKSFHGIDNIEYLQVPYPNNLTIDRILSESLLVFLPFRKLTTHPQLAVIESATFEVPVITSRLQSNLELSSEYENIIAEEEEGYTALIRSFLEFPSAEYSGVREKIFRKHTSGLYAASLLKEYD